MLLLALGCVSPKTTETGPVVRDTQDSGDTADTQESVDSAPPDTDTGAAHGPDLVYGGITTSPEGAGQFESVTYTIYVRNDGDEDLPATTGGVYYTDNTTVTVYDTFACNFAVDALAAGDGGTVVVSCTVPELTQGTWRAGAVLDEADDVIELDEDNNSGRGASGTEVEVGDWPDVTWGYFYADDYEITSGTSDTLHFSVENHGTLDTSTYILFEFYLSDDDVITRDDLLIESGYVNYIVPVDGAVAYYGSFAMPEVTTATTYYLGAILDPEDELEELNETNNTLVLDDRMTITPVPTYDVSVTSVSTAEHTVEETNTVSYTVEVANAGNATTAASSLALVYSTDTDITTSDTSICTVSVGAILAAGSTTLTGTCAAPAGLDGAYWFGAVADSGRSISETDETNNAGYDGASTVTVAPAHWDLEPSGVSAGDYTVDWKDTVTFAFDVTNNGTSDRTGFDVGLYYSTDTSITTGDSLLCTDAISTSLAAGASYTYAVSCEVPPLAADSYTFGVMVDPDGDVREDDETNNVAFDATPVDNDGVNWNLGADLIYEASSTLSSGDTDTYYFEVVNNGTDDVEDYTIELYYSTDSSITTSDNLICSFPGESISALARVTYSASCTVPAVSTYAYYYLGFLVDPDREVDETDETDNDRVGPDAILISP